MHPQTLTFDIPDLGNRESTHRVNCTQWGDADAPRTILCVHGLTRNGRDFDWLAQALADNARVLCPDMPGRGQSAWLNDPKGYSYPAYVADIAFMLKTLGITRLQWIGTSMGGIIGMMAANAMPGLIERLVLNDIGSVVSGEGLKRILRYAGQQPLFASRAEAEAALRERCAPFGITDERQWQQLFAHSFRQDANGNIAFACDPDILAAIPKDDVVKDIDLWALWEAVTAIPTLLIRGEYSDIITAATAQAMQARHPQLTLQTIPNTGHAPALMDQSQIDVIKNWLNA